MGDTVKQHAGKVLIAVVLAVLAWAWSAASGGLAPAIGAARAEDLAAVKADVETVEKGMETLDDKLDRAVAGIEFLRGREQARAEAEADKARGRRR